MPSSRGVAPGWIVLLLGYYMDYPGRAIGFAADQNTDLEALLEEDEEDAAMSGMSDHLIKHLADPPTIRDVSG